MPAFRPRQAALDFGLLPVLPQHWWQGRAFDRTSLEPPLGSGPYRVASVDAGRRVTLERVRMPWSDRLPVMRGAYNFDRIEIVYIRDRTAQFEAFLAGDIDVFADANPRHWASAYDVEPVRDGRIRRLEQRNWFGMGMNGFMFNLRSPLFADRRAREALTLMYDFEWANRVLFHGGYGRSVSYFQNTPLAAREAPDARELELLRQLPPGLPPEALTRAFKPAVSDGSGRDRRLLERDYNTLMLYGRLLDRALQWQYLGVPGNIEESRKLAVWDRFGWPARPPDSGYGMEYWWSRKTAAAGAEIR